MKVDFKGFSLVELILVIGIMLIIFAAAVPVQRSIFTKSQSEDSTARVVQAIRWARERAVAGYNNSAHGVYIYENRSGNDELVLYRGSSYAGRASNYDVTTTMDTAISLDSNFLDGGVQTQDLNFSKFVGAPSATGTITITHSDNIVRTVTINDYGLAYE